MSKWAVAWTIVFMAGAGLRVASVGRPIDRAENLWREADLASIARNFDREGMNILYPRVDWRGDGPGYAEMEFPVYPWAIACLHRLFGLNEAFGGRLLAFLFSLLALATFFRLAAYCLPRCSALAAAAFFALNPLAIEVSYRLLADGLMFLCYLVAVYAFVRWIDAESWANYTCALVATSCAILAKAPALHIGLLFAALVLWKHGAGAIVLPRLWVFAAVALVGPVLWYRHAYGLWLAYGNSLGMSNEYHWVGWDIFTNPRFVGGIVKRELLHVWMPPSLVVVVLGCVWSRSRRAVYLGCTWLGVIALYYILTMRTTSGIWGLYYHVVSVPAVALLVGSGVDAIVRLTGTALRGAGNEQHGREQERRPRALRLAGYVGIVSLCATYLWEGGVAYALISDRTEDPLYVCAKQFNSVISGSGLLLASGGICRDPTGLLAAGNKPYMFYWLDRKGFNICEEEQSIQAVESFAARGATFYVAEKQALQAKPGFETELRKAFPVVAECDAALLLRLRPNAADHDG